MLSVALVVEFPQARDDHCYPWASVDTYLRRTRRAVIRSAESRPSQNSDRVSLRSISHPHRRHTESATPDLFQVAEDFIVHPPPAAGRSVGTYRTQPAWTSRNQPARQCPRKGCYVAADLPRARPTSGTVSFGPDTTASRRSGNIAPREPAKAPAVVTYPRHCVAVLTATSTTATAPPSPPQRRRRWAVPYRNPDGVSHSLR